MEWTDIRLTVAKADADNAEAVATMIAEGGIYIEDYSDIEQQVAEIAHVDLIEQELLDKPRDTVIIHMYLEPGASPVETLALIAARMEAAGIAYTAETEGGVGDACRLHPGGDEGQRFHGGSARLQIHVDDDLVAGLIQQLLLNEIHMGDLSHLLLNVTVVFNINAALGDHGGHGLGVVGIGFGHGQANISPFHCGKSSCFEKCCTYIELYPIPPGDARCLPEKPRKEKIFQP